MGMSAKYLSSRFLAQLFVLGYFLSLITSHHGGKYFATLIVLWAVYTFFRPLPSSQGLIQTESNLLKILKGLWVFWIFVLINNQCTNAFNKVALL